MRIVTASNGKKTVKIAKSEWETIGKKHGWMRTVQAGERPGGALADHSMEYVESAARELAMTIHSLFNQEAKQTINAIIARPLSEVISKVQEFKQQGIGYVQR